MKKIQSWPVMNFACAECNTCSFYLCTHCFYVIGFTVRAIIANKYMKYERTRDGSLEYHLSDNSDQFLEIAAKIILKLKATQIVKMDGLDQSYWEMKIENEDFTIHREHYLGVMIFSKSSKAEKIFDRIQKLMRL